MKRKATIKDVARAAAVSVGTVSRVVNGHPAVDPATRLRVLKVMAELDFTPDALAQSLRTQVTRTIGFVVPDISNPLWAQILRSASKTLHTQGYSVMVASTNGERTLELDVLAHVARRRMDAFLLTLDSPLDAELQRGLEQLAAPVVVMERDLGEPWNTVVTDHGGGAYAATRYLIGLGHRRIALVTAQPGVRPSAVRIRGYRRAHEEAGLPVDAGLVRCGTFQPEFGFHETSRLLSQQEPPTAVIAGGTQLLPGVLRAASLQGIAIPQEVSVVGCGDTDLAQLTRPAVTVVSSAPTSVGLVAAETLLRILAGSDDGKPSHVVLPTELILRDSCAPPNPRLTALRPPSGIDSLTSFRKHE
jgi:LacI family transcriptional regulator